MNVLDKMTQVTLGAIYGKPVTTVEEAEEAEADYLGKLYAKHMRMLEAFKDPTVPMDGGRKIADTFKAAK